MAIFFLNTTPVSDGAGDNFILTLFPVWRPTPWKSMQLFNVFCFLALKNLGKPDDISSAALFLSSDESNYITGSDLYVDGGWSAI